MQKTLWFAMSFAGTITALVVGSELFKGGGLPTEADIHPSAQLLVDVVLPTSGIVSAITGAVVPDFGRELDDATVILLGGIGCSPNQLEVLARAQALLDSVTTHSATIALYADPSLGVERGKHESLILRRVSRAKFPFVVSTDPEFDLRALRIRAPQIARVRGGRILEIVPLGFENNPVATI